MQGTGFFSVEISRNAYYEHLTFYISLDAFLFPMELG